MVVFDLCGELFGVLDDEVLLGVVAVAEGVVGVGGGGLATEFLGFCGGCEEVVVAVLH